MFIEIVIGLKLAQYALKKLNESSHQAERFKQTQKIAKKYAKATPARRRKGGITLGRVLLLPLLALTAVATAKPGRKPRETMPGSYYQDPNSRYKF